MSGNGLISVRLPRSLMAAFEENAARTGIDVHEAARRLIHSLGEVSDDELISLPEPQRESDNPRISLYIGWPQIETLAAVSERTQLSMSQIVRRLIYGAVVGRSVGLGTGKTTHRLPRPVEDSEFIAVVFVFLAIAVVGALFLYRWARYRKRKRVTETQKLRMGGDKQREANSQ
jgi:hypothetical protein